MRVLPNKTKSNRSSGRIRKGPHARTHALWQILLVSLVLDPILSLLTAPRIPIELALTLAVACLIACLPFLAQGSLHKVLSKLRHLHTSNLEGGSRLLPLIFGLGIGGVVFTKLIMLSKVPPVFALALMVLAAWGTFKYIIQVSKQSGADRALFAANPWAKVQRWEQQVLIFATLPLILARVIGLCGALVELPAGDEAQRLVFIGVSALYLIMLRPDRSFFMGMCTRCKTPVPIVFQDLGGCLNCDHTLRVAYHAWVRGIALVPTQNTPAPLTIPPPVTPADQAKSAPATRKKAPPQ